LTRHRSIGRWQVQQPFPGIYVWRDPHGGFHLVDHTGTRRIPGAPQRKPLMVELWRTPPGIQIEVDYPHAA